MASENANSGEGTGTAAQGEVLKVNDVLSGIPLDGGDAAGAYLTFETIGNSMVISVDADGLGPEPPVAILTLANVAGKTLQDLLNDIPLNV